MIAQEPLPHGAVHGALPDISHRMHCKLPSVDAVSLAPPMTEAARARSARGLRQLMARIVLACLLVFSQQQAVLHWLSHAIEATQESERDQPAHPHCDLCDQLVAFAASLPASPVALPARTELSFAVPALHRHTHTRATACAAYEPRAPPLA